MAPIDLEALDSAVHGPIRLSVLALLRLEGPLDFTTIKKRLDVSDGVLGAHLLRLEQAGYVASRKEFVGRRPRTTYRLPAAGKTALIRYLEAMERLIHAVSKAP
jgi:DNA-binding transcriptional ArsR family regulator